jgi:hypothetical protein
VLCVAIQPPAADPVAAEWVVLRRLVAIGVRGVVVSACGSTAERQSAVPTPVIVPPSPAPPRPALTLPSPVISPPQNRNDRSTPMGSLCWARRSVVIALVESVGTGTVDTDMMAHTLRASADELRRVRAQLPHELARFTERFERDLSSVVAQLDAGALTDGRGDAHLFDFEQYPDVTVYVDVAGRTPECRDP